MQGRNLQQKNRLRSAPYVSSIPILCAAALLRFMGGLCWCLLGLYIGTDGYSRE